MTEEPLVSILTPTYNQANYLRELLENVLEQDYPKIEHVIVNDGSTDDTEEILKYYQNKYTLKWVTQKNAGAAAAFNKAFYLSTGEFIGWINSDDRYYGRKAISRLVKRLISSKASVVYGNIHMINKHGVVLRKIQSDKELFLRNMCRRVGLSHNAALFKRNVFESYGVANPLYAYIFDWDMLIRYLLQGVKFEYADDTYAEFRYHDASKTKMVLEETSPFSLGSRLNIKINEIIKMFESYLEKMTINSKQWKDLAIGIFPYYRQIYWLLHQGGDKVGSAIYLNKLKRLAPRLLFVPGIGINKYLWIRVNLILPGRIKKVIKLMLPKL